MTSLFARYCQSLSPALQRYYRASLWPSLLFLGLAALHEWATQQPGLVLPLRIAIALAPALAMAWMFAAYLRFLRDCDELERRIETEAIGAASLLVSLLYFAGGMLQKAEVIDLDAGIAMIWVFPLLCGTYGIAKMILTRRYL